MEENMWKTYGFNRENGGKYLETVVLPRKRVENLEENHGFT